METILKISIILTIAFVVFIILRSFFLFIFRSSFYFDILRRIFGFGSILAILSFLTYLFFHFSQFKYGIIFEKLYASIFVFSLALVISNLTIGFLKIYVRSKNIILPPSEFVFDIIKLIFYTLGFITILNIWNVPIIHFITTFGIGALAISLALQGTLSNFFAGLNIIISKNLEIGDCVKLENGEEGTISDITWLNTIIKKPDGTYIIIPNLRLFNSILINYKNLKDLKIISLPIKISYFNDIKKIEKITLEVLEEIYNNSTNIDKSFKPSFKFLEFADNYIRFNVYLKVLNYQNKEALIDEFLRKLKERYDRESVIWYI
ncbi:MAG: mechanosensitive ion channel domain-containing protein [candidate division WOR-3 bacterium]